MNDHLLILQEYLIAQKAPKDVLHALRAIDERMQTYAIDIDDAEKALGWKGIRLSDTDSIATGIEKLYAREQELKFRWEQHMTEFEELYIYRSEHDPEGVDNYLRAHGYDPEQIGKDAVEFVRKLERP